jgi:hypothetical protein
MNRIALIIVSVIVMTARGVAQDEPTVNGQRERRPLSSGRRVHCSAAGITRARGAYRLFADPALHPGRSAAARCSSAPTIARWSRRRAVATFMMFSKRVHLVLDVQEDGTAIRFIDRCGKSFEHYAGTWTFAELDGRTQITYELTARPLFTVPEFLLKRLMKRDASQMIERLKTEIAARVVLD